jgi:NADH-quinone oxidoreductase subunit G
MPRPQPNMITFTIDGREVRAPENMMLVDAAKLGDVEIPVFCYEPKLGSPVGACRMCLVEIEGIPKLQTGCSTPVKDGMVVHTSSPRALEAQRAVVEFLLINHPLDCPVCDKGGECPLQDITFGWGPGVSRFIEPKRHFVKPLELSPLIAIDRERCILCYRCVRFSQEVSEDYQLVLLERAAHSYVSTFDSHPYVAPFSGNIIELCPVGALTSRAYRFRARPWDIEGGGSICTLCPAQCNVRLTVRDERVLRVLARDHPDVDDGWLCDKGRFAYQSMDAEERVIEPLIRDGGELRPVPWEIALDRAAAGLRRGKAAALAGGGASNEEGFLLGRLLREALHSGLIDTPMGVDPADLHRLSEPELQATVPDLEFAHTVLVIGTEPVDDMPILDLRIRKGRSRQGVTLAIAGPRPSALEAQAELCVRYAPGGEEAFLSALASALYGGDVEGAAQAAGSDRGEIERLARLLRTGALESGEGLAPAPSEPHELVILYGQRWLSGAAVDALLRLARGLGLAGRAGSGLLGVPGEANGRGLMEAGVAPGYGPGYVTADEPGAGGVREIGEQLADGELGALYLLDVDPLRAELPRALWQRALEQASTVIAHASFLSEDLREHADVVFPLETYAEKNGTVVHPDGRVQRLRSAVARPRETRPGWWVLAELARRCGLQIEPESAEAASVALFAAAPIYRGLTLEEVGGRGVRWQEREHRDGDGRGRAFPEPPEREAELGRYAGVPAYNGSLRLGRFRSIWAAPEVEASPALRFLTPHQTVEMAPADCQRLELLDGERALVRSESGQVEGRIHVRAACPPGSVFLQDAIGESSASALEGPLVEILSAPREEARLAEEARVAEEARLAEETRLAEERRLAEEAGGSAGEPPERPGAGEPGGEGEHGVGP